MKQMTAGQIIAELKRINIDNRLWGLILIGCPASGKSTFVQKVLAELPNTHIASTDDMIDKIAAAKGITYTEAFNKHVNMKQLKKQMLAGITENAVAGINIINDQTNMGKKARGEKIALMPNHTIIAIGFDVPEAEIKRRLAERESATGKHIPAHVITNMLSNYEAPSKAEGFAHIWQLQQ
jgi:predicted kinase